MQERVKYLYFMGHSNPNPFQIVNVHNDGPQNSMVQVPFMYLSHAWQSAQRKTP